MKKLSGSLFIAVLFLFIACEEQNPVLEGFGHYSNGVFIVNEGGFNKNNGSLSFYSKDSSKVINNVFLAANNESNTADSLQVKIGDIFQSMTILNDEAYLVANNSQKITVVNRHNLTVVTTLENLSYPRFVVKGTGETAYISNGNGFGGDAVYVVNTLTHQISDTIAVGSGPERMLLSGDKLFVACMGGFTTNNLVYVIDITTKEIVKIIETADRPGDLVKDKDNNIWVLAAGATLYDANWAPIGTTPAKLSKIDAASLTVTDSLTFNAPLSGFGSNFLAVSKDGAELFVKNKDIIKVNVDTKNQTVLVANAEWYGIDVDPYTGYIWGFTSVFGSNGKAVVYSETGNKLYEYQVGEGPNAAVFVE